MSQPALGLIQLGQALQIADGRGIVVAIIDTGVDPHHPALAGSLVPGYDFTRDLAGPGSEWTDLNASTVEILDSANPAVVDTGAPVEVNPSTLAVVDQTTASLVDLLRGTLRPRHDGRRGSSTSWRRSKIMPLKAFDADGTPRPSTSSARLLRGRSRRQGHQHELQLGELYSRAHACDRYASARRHLRRVGRQLGPGDVVFPAATAT
jgi:subtilisin family serine protease